MSELDFQIYCETIKTAFPNPQKTSVTLALFGFLEFCPDIKNKKNETFIIDNKMASNWWNRTEPIPKTIRTNLQRADVITIIEKYFADTVYPMLREEKLDEVLSKLTKLIGKQRINADARAEILKLLDQNNLSEFLAQTFILAVKQSTKGKKANSKTSTTKKADAVASAQNLENNITELTTLLSKIPALQRITPPKQPAPSEAPYIFELLSAYGDAEGLPSFSENELSKCEKYQNHFNRQRESYYAAESVRRGAQDLQIANKENLFNSLKDETFDGIIDVHEQDYINGFERLKKVMIHATTLPITKSILGKIPQWVGSNEKKGLCHMLANEGRLRWVRK